MVKYKLPSNIPLLPGDSNDASKVHEDIKNYLNFPNLFEEKREEKSYEVPSSPEKKSKLSKVLNIMKKVGEVGAVAVATWGVAFSGGLVGDTSQNDIIYHDAFAEKYISKEKYNEEKNVAVTKDKSFASNNTPYCDELTRITVPLEAKYDALSIADLLERMSEGQLKYMNVDEIVKYPEQATIEAYIYGNSNKTPSVSTYWDKVKELMSNIVLGKDLHLNSKNFKDNDNNYVIGPFATEEIVLENGTTSEEIALYGNVVDMNGTTVIYPEACRTI